MSKKFKEHQSLNLPGINSEVLEMWEGKDIFHRTMTEREGCGSYVFYEGPPSANGRPGIHHVLARTIKDIFCRYKTMQGYQVNRRAGWDTHGLPVELGVEKNLGITKEDIGKKISVDEYNAACRAEVMKYTREWEDLTRKMGYWVDMPSAYITYDNRYIETVWWLLARLYKKGYLYKGYTIQPYSPAAGTGLSSHELNQPGCYRDVKDTTCIAQFKVKADSPSRLKTPVSELSFLAWTTTPWTLPSNTALAVGPNVDYVVVKSINPYSKAPITVIVAESLAPTLFKEEYEVVEKVKGSELVGMKYEQLLPWVNPGEGAFRVIPGDFVTTDEGTGVVHIAGTFGADDQRVSKQNGIPPLHLLDRDGNIRPMVDLKGRFFMIDDLDENFVKTMVNVPLYSKWQGKYVKNAFNPEAREGDETLDIEICMDLKASGKVFKIEKHVHSYPHCWRTDKPVLYYPLDSWFIRTTDARDRLIELNKTINWKPASTGSGRFGKWLENVQDWNLSRSRYWGTPLPIWRTDDGKEEVIIDSVETLYKELDRAVDAGFMQSNPLRDKGFVPGDNAKENYEKIDLHRPYVDSYILVSPTGKKMYREKDLIDVWFDSGSMPYAQIHYPFENREALDNRTAYPADFIAEGVDQTRGWFFTLHAIAGMAFDSVAYKAVVSNGLVLDKFGNKMSKRLGNAVNPFEAIDKYGADAVRFYMISNSQPWDNLKFDEGGVLETSRKLFSTLYNVYGFFSLYANVDGYDPDHAPIRPEAVPEIDRWIISLLNTLVQQVTEALDDYEPTKASRAIAEFVSDNLSNWYVRLNRKRFWGTEMTPDKLSAYDTLYTCLLTLSKLLAPFAPFFAEQLYQDLCGEKDSVHLDAFPKADSSLTDKALERRMALAQEITSMALALRRKANEKVRQPLTSIIVSVPDKESREDVLAVKNLILNEINVKEMNLPDDDTSILVKRVKPDFKKLGPKFGKQMKAVAAAITSLDQAQISSLEKDGEITLQLAGQPIKIEAGDVEIISQDIPGFLVANSGPVTIALDVTVTPELRSEGLAREIVNRVQNLRKSRNYDITDRVQLRFESVPEADEAIRAHRDYIARQVLATDIDIVPQGSEPMEEILEIDQLKLPVTIINPNAK